MIFSLEEINICMTVCAKDMCYARKYGETVQVGPGRVSVTGIVHLLSAGHRALKMQSIVK